MSDGKLVKGFGNWRKPRSAGMWNLSAGQTFMFLGLLVLSILVMMFKGLAVAVGFFLVASIPLGLTLVRNVHDRTILDFLGDRVMFLFNSFGKRNRYVAGMLQGQKRGRYQLPGLLGTSQLHDFTDSAGNRFGLIENPRLGLYTVVLSGQPDGLTLVDKVDFDAWVANWSGVLAQLGHDPGIEMMSVTVESAPDTGDGLKRELKRRRAKTAHPLSVRVADEISQVYPAGSNALKVYVAFTFNAAIGETRRRKVEDFAHDIAVRLQGICGSISASGAGNVRPLGALEICKVARLAFDPLVENDLIAAGDNLALKWSDVGPVVARAEWGSYIHSGVRSISWEMSGAPRGVVQARVLESLLAPVRDVLRKRVTMIYRPMDAGKAAEVVDRDLNHAQARILASRKGKVRSSVEWSKAEQTAKEEASGAGIEDFGMIVTASVNRNFDLQDVSALIETIGAQGRVRLRKCYGMQDSAFAVGLPFGVVPWRYRFNPGGGLL